MRLAIVTEARYFRGPDDTVLSPGGANAYPLWSAYRGPFDSVTVVARVRDVPGPVPASCAPVEGPGVRVQPVTSYLGLPAFARARRAVRRDLLAAMAVPDTAWLLRPPGLLTGLASRLLADRAMPYAVEVVGDAAEVLRSGVVPGAGPLLARPAGRAMARVCTRATAAAYVAEHLRERYPCPGPAQGLYSSVDLPDEAFAAAARTPRPAPVPHLLAVGTHTQRYKGHDVLIDALAILRERGVRARLSLIGGGRHQPWLRARAAASPAAADIAFLGEVGTEQVRAALDACDVFVLPSRTEGMPRALLEAMARGVPCVASAVGGVPELLPADRLAPPGDAGRLADRLAALLADPAAMAADSARNLRVARRYARERMRAARTAFLTEYCAALQNGSPHDTPFARV